MRWIEALKIWNAKHNPGKWCVARKGSPEYDQVKAIMAAPAPGGKTATFVEKLKAKKAEAKELKEAEKPAEKAAEKPAEKPTEKPLSKKAKKEAQKKADDELYNKLKQQAREQLAKEAEERKAAEKAFGGTKKEDVLRDMVLIPALKAKVANKKRELIKDFLRKAIKERLEKKAAASAPKAPAPAETKTIKEPRPSELAQYDHFKNSGRNKPAVQAFEQKYKEYFEREKAKAKEGGAASAPKPTSEVTLEFLKSRLAATEARLESLPPNKQKMALEVRKGLRNQIEALEGATASEPKAPAPAERSSISKDERKMELYRTLARDKKLLTELIAEGKPPTDPTVLILKKVIAKTEKMIKKMN